jgi:uncharacterized iron-regulated protein
MKNIVMGILGFFSSLTSGFGQSPVAYAIFDSKGKAVSYEKMIKELSQADVVLFGEYHDNPICHWFEIELAKALFEAKKENFVIGAEMFESDNQLILDEYLAGKIKENHLTDEAKVWNNYKTDYKPLVEFAKEKNIPFVATNIPRRYASMVARLGTTSLEGLAPAALTFICKLPFEVDMSLSQYQKMLGDIGMPHGGENMVKAQAIKDATMAHFILKNWEKNKLFFHINGSYHSDYFQGIVWYLNRSRSGLKVATVSSRVSDDPNQFEATSEPIGSFILQINSKITKSY